MSSYESNAHFFLEIIVKKYINNRKNLTFRQV